MRVYQKSEDEIQKMYRTSQAVRKTLDELEAASKPGVSTWDLNELADKMLKKLGAKSADYQGGTFPSPLVGQSPTSLPPPRVTRARFGCMLAAVA